MELPESVCAASGAKDDGPVAWFRAIRDDGTTLVDLDDYRYPYSDPRFKSRRYQELDRQIAAAFSESGCAPTTFHTKISKMDEECMQKGQLLRGRQIVWLVLDFLKVDQNGKGACSLSEIHNLPWLGDKHLREFWDSWCEPADAPQEKWPRH